MDRDKVIAHYVALRDQLKDMEKQHKEQLAPLKQDMELIEAALQKDLQEQGLKQFKGDHGTAFIKVLTNAKVTDWEGEALPWLVENERWDLLVRNVNKTNMLETEAEVPGVEISQVQKLQINRSSK